MGFNPTKTKVQLKLALNRLQLLQQKKSALNQNARREIATLLRAGKIDSATVRVGWINKVENIIREDFLVEALELLQLYVDVLLARFGLVTSLKELDPGLAESVHAIVYAAPRVDVQELNIIKDQLVLKYGRELQDNCNNHPNEFVNPRILHKLTIATPDPNLVSQYLKTIAQAFDVPFEVKATPTSPVKQDTKNMAFHIPESGKQPISNPVVPQVPAEGLNEKVAPPSAPDQEPDFDYLSRRFESLKKA